MKDQGVKVVSRALEEAGECCRRSEPSPTTDDFWSNRFHWCALAAGFIAAGEGRLDDALHVRDLAYRMFEEGAFREREPKARETSAVNG